MMKNFIIVLSISVFCWGCQQKPSPKSDLLAPTEIIDLGTLVTEDLPDQFWSRDIMNAMGFEKSNQFDVRNWSFDMDPGKVSGSNTYFTIFNHGGPHMDGPNHVGFSGGLDSYPIEKFIGPLKVFDGSSYTKGRTVPAELFRGKVSPGDVVLLYTHWTPPLESLTEPAIISLTHEAAEFLAQVPVRAFCTDAFSVDCFGETEDPILSDSETALAMPIHHSFLSCAIPVFEQLCNTEKLLTKQNMLFVGVPLNMKDADGMIVRPVVLVY